VTTVPPITVNLWRYIERVFWIYLPYAVGLRISLLVARSRNLCKSSLDFRQHTRRPRLRNDPFRLGQMLNRERALLFDLVKEAQDHFASTDMMAVRIKPWVLANPHHKRCEVLKGACRMLAELQQRGVDLTQ
jgi:hypothetical protein